jgi:hypothetical protein
VIADPKFVNPEKEDFRLPPDSPAFSLGFQAFDPNEAGRTTPPVLTAGMPEVPAGLPKGE